MEIQEAFMDLKLQSPFLELLVQQQQHQQEETRLEQQ